MLALAGLILNLIILVDAGSDLSLLTVSDVLLTLIKDRSHPPLCINISDMSGS